MRGENTVSEKVGIFVLGSPPLARGKLMDIDTMGIVPRITPACAGKTFPSEKYHFRCQDHPRLRGENLFYLSQPFFCVGSPPLARGKLQMILMIPQNSRITPACAGKTHGFCNIPIARQDHPRLRGENILLHLLLTTE